MVHIEYTLLIDPINTYMCILHGNYVLKGVKEQYVYLYIFCLHFCQSDIDKYRFLKISVLYTYYVFIFWNLVFFINITE